MNMKTTIWVTIALLVLSACGDGKKHGKASGKAEQQIQAAYRAKNYQQLITLADSLQQTGDLSVAEADYWIGYANDRLMQRRVAEFYWKSAVNETEESTDAEDLSLYAKSASRLTNLLTLRGDVDGALKVAEPVARRLEALGCDSTSDYTNLLVFIGCCQSRNGTPEETVNSYYERAYGMHQKNVEDKRTDEAFKNAIAGIINIAYNCLGIEKYNDALTWTENFGKFIRDYELRDNAPAEYIDKQWARYAIYRAIALEGLGKKEEAAQAFNDYQQTKFSQTSEGHIDATDYLIAAQRWDEAADAYRSLDGALSEHETALSLEDMQNLVLKKYRTNLLAGRRDSANAVARQICEALDSAITQSRRLDNEEQEIVRQKEAQLAELEAQTVHQRTLGLLAAIALVFIGFSLYTLYRRKATHQLTKDHKNLQAAYSQLEEEATTNGRIECEQRMARSLQQSVLPASQLRQNGLALHATLTPGKQMATDLYDYLLRDGKLLFCIGENKEKDFASTQTLALARAQFHAAAAYEDDPARIMNAINQTTAQAGNQPVSFFVGTLDAQTGLLRYCNAAHQAPLLVGTAVEELSVTPNAPIGEDGKTTYATQKTTLAPGTVIFLYTDGLPGAKNKEQKVFGENRMKGEALQTTRGLDPTPLPFIERMTETLNRFTGGIAQDDDITMLAIRYTK